MKFSIYKRWNTDPTEKSTSFKHYSVTTSCSSEYENGTEEEKCFQKFKNKFEQEYGSILNTSQLSINFDDRNSDNGETISSSFTWEVTIEGEILGKLHKFLGYGSDSLKMHLEVTKFLGRNQRRTVVDVSDFVLDDGSILESPHPAKYIGKSGIYSGFTSDTETGTYDISLSVSKPLYLCTDDLLEVVPQTSRNIFESKKLCDFEIIVDDDDKEEAGIACHKIFLYVGSPVFARMLEGTFAETLNNKMKFTGVSRSGVEALLKFLYYSDLLDALASPTVALELLQIADQYDMPVLWKAIITLFMKVEHGWFDVKTALKLFEFLRNRDADEYKKPLMKKVIQVMALKWNQLPTCNLFMEIFRNPVSRDMMNLALETNKP